MRTVIWGRSSTPEIFHRSGLGPTLMFETEHVHSCELTLDCICKTPTGDRPCDFTQVSINHMLWRMGTDYSQKQVD